MLQFKLTKAQREWLEKEAKRTGISKADVVRVWINEKIEESK